MAFMPNCWEKINRKFREISCNKNHNRTKEIERRNGRRIGNKEDDCQGKEERKVVSGTPIVKGDGYLLKMVWFLKNTQWVMEVGDWLEYAWETSTCIGIWFHQQYTHIQSQKYSNNCVKLKQEIIFIEDIIAQMLQLLKLKLKKCQCWKCEAWIASYMAITKTISYNEKKGFWWQFLKAK